MSVSIPNTSRASPESVAALEKAFGQRLPKGYLRFLRSHDGAKPERNIFSVGMKTRAELDRFIPADEILHIAKSVEGFPPNSLPIARASGGNFVYINLKSGEIYFWDHEDDSGDVKLSQTFESFLDLIKPCDLNDIKLKPGQVTKVWVKEGFKPKFD